jgi:hypothetical protein
MGSGKDKVPRKRKSHGAGEGAAREEANRKRAKKKEAEKAGCKPTTAGNRKEGQHDPATVV